MNRSKLTPCRKVGLSKKRNTPGKTVESLLNRSENITTDSPSQSSITEKLSNVEIHKNRQKGEQNHDTPCRQVGLSRKRKGSTPLNGIRIEGHLLTTISPNPLLKGSSKKENVTHAIMNSKEKIQSSCSKRLSTKFDSTPTHQDIRIKSESQNNPTLQSHLINGVSKRENSLDYESDKGINQSDCSEQSSLKLSCVLGGTLDSEKIEDESLELNKKMVGSQEIVGVENLSKRHKIDIKEISVLKNHQDEVVDELKHLRAKHKLRDLKVGTDDQDFVTNKSQFIKISYKSEKSSPIPEESNDKNSRGTKSLIVEKLGKFSREIFDDNDDFDMNPNKKKSKMKLKRFKTDIPIDSEKETKFLKKSLSVDGNKMRTVSSDVLSEISFDNCFVKLEKMKVKATKKSPKISKPVINELSDDDFDTFTSTPRENIRTNIDNLEKEIEEKKQLLEELKRAKLCKKIHNIDELKKLTLRWKNGCMAALKDLLEQLNQHTSIDMQTLLRKLNIPQDFMDLR